MKRVFGYSHVGGFFTPLIEIDEQGFTYRGRRYGWGSIRSIWQLHPRKLPGLLWMLWLFFNRPYTIIRLTDGTRFWINGRSMAEEGRKPDVEFLSGASDAYYTLLAILRAHGAQQGVPADRPRPAGESGG